ncbi:hypothetical protein AF72_06945 [Xylella taiwanensis]|uniref:Uncharacterized protein n=1 Tax=Xylella taiwanensis TaxID=1444770 RepID=Z9JIK1_9GAMM|nr:hypothetical protein AF72_06945 [Xylella taiwanensis]
MLCAMQRGSTAPAEPCLSVPSIALGYGVAWHTVVLRY